jgi:predicted ATPase/DNA-binding SARP family transcriptional activator
VEIAVGEREISERQWSGRLPRMLLLLLLATPGHRLPRDRVLDLLWPEAEPEAALNALYKALHSVRRTLEPDLKAGRGSAYVATRGETIGLVPVPGTWVDADEFDATLARADTLSPAERRPTLRAALNLYSGDLLSDEPYADWPVARREALRQARERATLALAALELEAGEPLATVPLIEDLLAGDPTVEEAHRALMRAYAAAGQRDRALRQFARCRSVLETELGAEPAAETIALREAIEGEHRTQAVPVASAVSSARPRPFYNFPAQPTALVGRDADIDEIQAMLWRQDVRLVTLTGPGGIGKTRLALQVAAGLVDDFSHGVAFVSLAPLRDPALVIPTIARTLDIREEVGRTIEETLLSALVERELLLVLDNFEHLLTAAPHLADLLAACSRLKALVTSREGLRLRGEYERVVRPLGLPNLDRLPAHQSLSRFGAVALFQQAVLPRRPDFAITSANARAVAEICVRLDGLPLAIELAAARCRHLTPEALLSQLAHPLDVLVVGPRDAPSRHQTLRDAIAWSYDLLAPAEQMLFRHLAIFTGGCTLEAAEYVDGQTERRTDGKADKCSSLSVFEQIASLADKSLVVWDTAEDPPRFRMLETIREFALERLIAAGEAENAGRAHAAFFVALAEAASRDHRGPRQAAALNRLETDRDNLRAALGWSVARADSESAFRLAGALWRYWSVRGHLSEGRDWLEQALALARDGDPIAQTLAGATTLSVLQGDYDAAVRYGEEALSAARRLDDRRLIAFALGELATTARIQGRFDDAIKLDDEALALCRESGDDWGAAAALNRQGILAYLQNEHGRAGRLLDEALAIFRRLGDRRVAALILNNLGVQKFYGGDFEGAIAFYEEGLTIAREFDDRARIMIALTNLGEVLRFSGDFLRGAEFAAEALALARAVGDKQAIAIALHVFGTLRQAQGDLTEARAHLSEELPLFLAIGDRLGIAWCLEALAGIAMATGQPETAARFLGAAAGLREEIRSSVQPAEAPSLASTEASTRAALGDEAFQLAWTAGRETIDETVSAAVAFGTTASVP